MKVLLIYETNRSSKNNSDLCDGVEGKTKRGDQTYINILRDLAPIPTSLIELKQER